ncbi:hypothetical protein NIIDMKKI_05690 [Mycobacterium kansasii]|uniref:Uncharacterized protein n=1 Tax=Mycobacterium kansasii TaxID=1768 RepID=A0A7G1I527_MYCKA|nr:hypothetical protein NIIDMKKI_05690 [Mycobacterium kansasii]
MVAITLEQDQLGAVGAFVEVIGAAPVFGAGRPGHPGKQDTQRVHRFRTGLNRAMTAIDDDIVTTFRAGVPSALDGRRDKTF